MKILLVNKYHYVKGGSETYHFGLAKLLEKHGHKVIFFAMNDEKNFPCEQSGYFSKNVDFNGQLGAVGKLKAGAHALYSFDAKKHISRLIEDEKPDLVHINLVHRHLTLSILDAIKKYNIPVVHTVHDPNCICPSHTMLTASGEVCNRCVTEHSYKPAMQSRCVKGSKAQTALAVLEAKNYERMHSYDKIDCYICPSAFFQKQFELSGITKSPVIHMTNFLPDGTVYSPVENVKDYFLFFGRLSPEKGVTTLLRAYAAGGFSNKLYFVGDGPLREEMQSYIDEHKLGGKVILTGFQSGEALKRYVDEAKCVILPSEWHENCPYSILEAQASGKPCIVSTYGGLPELIEDGKNGFICEPFKPESLCECMKKINALSQEEYRAMSAASSKNAEKLCDSENYYNKLISLYKELIDKKAAENGNT